MIKIKTADLVGASGTYIADGAFRVRCFVTNDEGAFDVWARSGNGVWKAEWPATLANDRIYTVRAELWKRESHAQVYVGPAPNFDPNFDKHFYEADFRG